MQISETPDPFTKADYDFIRSITPEDIEKIKIKNPYKAARLILVDKDGNEKEQDVHI